MNEETDTPKTSPGTLCPGCSARLIDCLGQAGEEVYDAVKCPKGCDLWELYNP